MSTPTYRQRVARRQCPTCCTTVEDNHVYCPDCRADMRQRYVARYRPLLPLRPPSVGDPDYPGPLLACCGTWTPVTTQPHHCPQCGRTYLTTKEALSC
jgi:predicted amidophosphoribosyltransferase